MEHRFGGDWTRTKLDKLQRYIQAYVTALKNQPFQKIYVDAFAGTGYVNIVDEDNRTPMFPEFVENDVQEFVTGSAQIALRVDPPFDSYLFIEKNDSRFAELSKLRSDFPEVSARIHSRLGDANAVLREFANQDWKSRRAVVFLDPYGMQVRWETISLLAGTRAIDLWILFPLGVAVNRLLKKDGNISPTVKRRLDDLFGTDEWFSEFFKPKSNPGLFDIESGFEKVANLDSIAEYFNSRLASVFAGVAPNPLKLLNSRHNPLYLLCFAMGNPNEKAKQLALKIAKHILAMN